MNKYILALCSAIALLAGTASAQIITNQDTEIIVGEHPFLLFNADAIPELRARTTQAPWDGIAAAAIERAQNLSYTTSGSYTERALRLKEVVSALALAVIVDEATDPADYTERFYNELKTGLIHLSETAPGRRGWPANTPVGSMLFDAILALDVFHNHLDETRRAELEALIAPHVNAVSSWTPSPQSVRALWALYSGDIQTYDTNRTAFLNILLNFFTSDGVFFGGSNYALARLNFYDREQKHLLLEIIRRHEPGALSTDRANTLRNGYEWTYGYAMAPHGWNHVFGDTSPNRRLNGAASYPDSSPTAAFRAGTFSTDARAYANLHLRAKPAGGLLYYLLVDPDIAEVPGRLAPSRVFRDGGAWFQTDAAPYGGISGAMWNATRSQNHTHKETNALSLVAYGNHLLANSGYAGWNRGAHGFDWAYINNRAVSANTVLIDYPLTDARNVPDANDHQSKVGAGITDYIISGEVDYARGDSGSALPNGRHIRYFAFVHPLDGLPGYWPVMDEVTGDASAQNAHAAWHPYATAVDSLEANTHYTAQTRHIPALEGPLLDEGPLLHIHLTTPASKVQTLDGVVAHFDNLSFVAPFLYNTYPLNAEKQARFGTVFFPEPALAAGPTPEFSRISGDGWHATRLQWPDARFDLWVVTTRDTPVTLGPIQIRGKAAWFRCAADGSILRHLIIEGGEG